MISPSPSATTKWIPGFEGRYMASTDGRIFRTTKTGLAPLIPRRLRSGYLRVTLCAEGDTVDKLVHRLILETFDGPCPPGMETRHLNGIRDDNRKENLVWGLATENAKDRRRHGTHVAGARHGSSKVSLADVIEIKRRLSLGETHRSIAKDFPISRRAVSLIAAGKRWARP